MVLLQFTILIDSIRLMIAIAIIVLILFLLYFINTEMIFTNDMYSRDNLLRKISNYVFSMDNIICRRGIRINHVTLINVHFIFYMCRNKNQIVDYAKDDLSLHLQRVCIHNYNIANVNWMEVYNYKFLYLYIVFYVNYSQLNVYRCRMIITIMIIIAIVLFVVYSKIDNLKGSNIFDIVCVNSYQCEIYIFCNVLCKKSNYSTEKILYQINCNYLSLIIVFGIMISWDIINTLNILRIVLNSLIETIEKKRVQFHFTTMKLVIMRSSCY